MADIEHVATILPTKDFRMRHKSNRIHNEDWEPKDAVEEVTEGEVQHEHSGAVPEVRVLFLVSIFFYVYFFLLCKSYNSYRILPTQMVMIVRRFPNPPMKIIRAMLM